MADGDSGDEATTAAASGETSARLQRATRIRAGHVRLI